MPAEDTDAAVAMVPPDILHVHMVNAFIEITDEFHVVDPLVAEVAGVVVEAKTLVAVQRLECPFRAGNVESNLGRVYLKREVHVHFLEHVEDRQRALRKIIEALLQVFLAGGREGVKRMPDGGPGKAVHDRGEHLLVRAGIEEPARRAGRVLDFLGGAATHALGIAVTPDVVRQDRLVPVVDQVADRLPDQVRRDGVAGQSALLQELPFLGDIAVILERFLDIKMIPPAGEFHPVVAHIGHQREQFFQWQVGPLAGEECDIA